MNGTTENFPTIPRDSLRLWIIFALTNPLLQKLQSLLKLIFIYFFHLMFMTLHFIALLAQIKIIITKLTMISSSYNWLYLTVITNIPVMTDICKFAVFIVIIGMVDWHRFSCHLRRNNTS